MIATYLHSPLSHLYNVLIAYTAQAHAIQTFKENMELKNDNLLQISLGSMLEKSGKMNYIGKCK